MISWFTIPDSINIAGQDFALITMIQTAIMLIVGFIIARIAKSIVSKRSRATLPSDYSRRLTLLVYYGIIAITVISALAQSGIDLAGLFVAGGVAGIIIGFATQSLFSNLISGIFLYIDKPLKVGDPVMITGKLPDISGVVVNIGVITSRFRIFDGTYVTLPNTDVFSSEIYNYSVTVARRIQISIGVGFNEDTDKVIDVIRDSLLNTPFVLVEPVPNIYVASIGESTININIWCWVPSNVLFDVQMQITNQIKKQLTENRIEIPLPQQILHITNRTDTS
ncbi:MAG TPA: mechanosensitive ion channel family protein [Nitrososphaeraceae archaeon]|nr:mechanosensitive ion channel family protein [Nitrososphaeraceae archaeon]